MSKIRIYTTPVCPYCVRAKSLFAKKGVTYEEIDVSQDAGIRTKMIRAAGGKRTVPQIFIGDRHIGGCDELYALDRAGGLDPLLAE